LIKILLLRNRYSKNVHFLDGIVKCLEAVTPAKAGVHNPLKLMDPRLRGDDKKNTSATYYELIFLISIRKRNQKKAPAPRSILRVGAAAGHAGTRPAGRVAQTAAASLSSATPMLGV
jgi:hypothetical protein